ncbi:MAG: transposase [Gemmatimonadota bacterium]
MSCSESDRALLAGGERQQLPTERADCSIRLSSCGHRKEEWDSPDPDRTCVCPAGKSLYRKGQRNVTRGYVGEHFRGAKRDCVPCSLRDRCLRHPERTEARQVAFFRGGTPTVTNPFTQVMKVRIDTVEGRSRYAAPQAALEQAYRFDRPVGRRYWRANDYDLREHAQRNRPTLGPRLAGKLHFFTGDMDDFYLNLAVYRMQEFLRSTTDPKSDAEFTYGRPARGHSWHAFPRAELVRRMGAHVRERMPAGEGAAGWSY